MELVPPGGGSDLPVLMQLLWQRTREGGHEGGLPQLVNKEEGGAGGS